MKYFNDYPFLNIYRVSHNYSSKKGTFNVDKPLRREGWGKCKTCVEPGSFV
jgi:hypothetical protein